MKKEKMSKVKYETRKVILNMANYFSDFESSKSIPFWCYEVRVPEELNVKKTKI